MGIDSDAFVALLPHRPPFRFVDAVEALAGSHFLIRKGARDVALVERA